MSSKYKYLSGSAKRKLQKERIEKRNAVSRQKITEFFKGNKLQELNESENDVQTEKSSESEIIICTRNDSSNNNSSSNINSFIPPNTNDPNEEFSGHSDPNLCPNEQFNTLKSNPKQGIIENWGFQMASQHVQNANENKEVTLQDCSENVCILEKDNEGKNQYFDRKCESETINIIQNFKDPGLWPLLITNKVRDEIVKFYPPNFEELLTIYPNMTKDLNGRRFSKYVLYSKSKNDRETYPRDWLIWSPSQQSLHCYPCLLFHSIHEGGQSVLAKRRGFRPSLQPWRKLYGRLPLHENSLTHKNCYIKWKTLEQAFKGRGEIGSMLQNQILSEIDNWKALLRRLLDVTLFLASRGLPFRGSSSELGQVNNGNFLGILELLGKYDEVTKCHLHKVKQLQSDNKGRGHSHYLSWLSQNEFISLCGNHVLKHILNEREKAIYYSIIVDATPDLSHQEQNVFIIRYILQNQDTNEYEIQERFVEFLNFNNKSGEEIAMRIAEILKIHKIPLQDCRGQGYDNGSNMSGKVKGVKSRILKENYLALFSPCGTHSLNLIGVNAAKQNPQVMTFFGCVQRLYAFFSGSPERWSILNKEIECSLTYISETRWSSRVDAVRPVVKHLPGILNALDRVLEEASNLSEKIYSEAKSLRKYFSAYETLIMASMWYKILASIDERNKILQTKGISLDIQVKLISDLKAELLDMRNKWRVIVEEATSVAEMLDIRPQFVYEKRAMKRKCFFDDTSKTHYEKMPDSKGAEDTFRTKNFYTALDFVISDLDHRFDSSKSICNLFSPVLRYLTLEETELEECCKKMTDFYNTDISSSLVDEIKHLRKVHNSLFSSLTELSPLELLNKITNMKLESIFRNVCSAIRIFLTLPVTVSEAERAFSKLSNELKTWQRSSVSQERLNSLALLSIEHKLATQLNFDSVINDFATMKARKANI